MFYNSHQKPYDHRKHSSSLIALHFQGKFYVSWLCDNATFELSRPATGPATAVLSLALMKQT